MPGFLLRAEWLLPMHVCQTTYTQSKPTKTGTATQKTPNLRDKMLQKAATKREEENREV